MRDVVYIWRDMGWSHIQSEFAKLNSTEIVAGLIGDAVTTPHAQSGLTVAEVGIINEFGSDDGHTPARSFMRDVLHRRKGEYKQAAAKAVRQIIYNKRPAAQAMGIIGDWAVRSIRANIERSTPPPNAPYTVARKGHARTLIDTGLMLASVGWEILSAAGVRLGISGSGSMSQPMDAGSGGSWSIGSV